MRNAKLRGYTLFELIAVLTVSGITFMVVMGSWNSWSTVHACNGAADILKSEIRQARALSMAKNRYVCMFLESYTTNRVQQITSSQLYLCTNDTGNIESLLGKINSSETANSQQNALYDMGITPAAPPQGLSSHIRISSYTEEASSQEESGVILFFRPDGSIWNGENGQFHYIEVYSRRLFNENPLIRRLNIDLTTGRVNIIRGEDL